VPTEAETTREEELTERFHQIEQKYTEDGIVMLGNATPEELRELGKLNRALIELRSARQPEEATA
jgi:hypothetical protein